MAGIWYDFNLHVRGGREQCEPLYEELTLAVNGGYDDDDEECIEERDNDFTKNVSPFVKNWLASAEKDNALYGGDAAFYNERASCYKREYEKAVADSKKALALDPELAESKGRLARLEGKA
jgi:hypothetical protein